VIKSLDRIVERLVTGCDPERIILFGSRADGTSDEGSDLDLLVVVEAARSVFDHTRQSLG
jgi:predicted nucleotidyltransferase